MPTATDSRAGVEIEVRGLGKRFRSGVVAVDDLSFRVLPGRITGFLGPNGAGKTTTLRCLLGLVRPTAGEALIGGTTYNGLQAPGSTVGASLEASGFHPGRSGTDVLRARCAALGAPADRGRGLLDFVGLSEAAARRVGSYSLGMKQRLALAQALVGDPGVLVLDEPANGLDPAGIAWLRSFLRRLADEGRTVLISSHLLAEVHQSVDDVVIIDKGRLVKAGPLADLMGNNRSVAVAGDDLTALRAALTANGCSVRDAGRDSARDSAREDDDGATGGDGILVDGCDPRTVGRLALDTGTVLHRLVEVEPELEQVFLSLTAGSGDHGGPR